MSDWWIGFQNFMYAAFNIPASSIVPALFSLLMVVSIVALILYEAFKKMTDNESVAGLVSILVGIAVGGYMLYNGSILWVARFGIWVIIGVFLLFFAFWGLSFWHKHAKGYYEARKGYKESKSEYKQAVRNIKKGEEEEAVKTIEEFWEKEREISKGFWKELKGIKKIDASNARDVAQILNNLAMNAYKEMGVCEKWRKYFKRVLRDVPEVKLIDKLIRGWTSAYNSLSHALNYIRSGDYDKAMKEISNVIGVVKGMGKEEKKGEEVTRKEENKTKKKVNKCLKEKLEKLLKDAINIYNKEGAAKFRKKYEEGVMDDKKIKNLLKHCGYSDSNVGELKTFLSSVVKVPLLLQKDELNKLIKELDNEIKKLK